MAVPTVTSITPDLGHTGGKALIEIIGTNFRTPTPQVAPNDGPMPVAPPSVEVLFGGVASPKVAWLSETRLYVQTPEVAEANVDVEVRNIDDSGVLIPGETVTVTDGFSFRLPQLTIESDLVAMIRTLLQSVKRQVHPNTIITVDTDFDDTTADLLNITKVATVPAIVIQGPELEENRFYSRNEKPQTDVVAEEFFEKDEPAYTCDVMFDVVLMSNKKVEHLNLTNAMLAYFKKNKTLPHPSNGETQEIEWLPAGEPNAIPRSSNDNLRVSRGAMIIRGVDLGEFHGFSRDLVVRALRRTLDDDDFFDLQPTTNLGQTFPVGASPGLPAGSPAVTTYQRTGENYPPPQGPTPSTRKGC